MSTLVLVALVALAEVAPVGLRSLSVDILGLVDQLPDAVVDGLVGAVQLVVTVVPFIAAVYLVVRRRFVLFGLCTLAALIASTLMALLGGLVEESIPYDQLAFTRANSWFIGSQYPSSTYLAALTAALVAASPWLVRTWRHAGWALIIASVIARALSATEVPLRNAMLLAIGAAAGSAALVLLGAPRRRLDPETVRSSLRRGGLDIRELAPVEAPRGAVAFTGIEANGAQVMVKGVGRDQRDTDLLLRMWRLLTVKGLTNEAPLVSPRRTVEHEALAMGLFRAADVSTPTALAVADTPDEAAVLAATYVSGRRMANLDETTLSDAALSNLWQQVARLQRRRFAHRALDATNILVDGDRCTLLDLRVADFDATDEVLGADVAELLVSTACIVGIERAVAPAVDALAADDLTRAVPMLQEPVLSSKTRSSAKRREHLVDDLRDRLADAAGMEQIVVAPVQRITIKGAVSLVGSIVLAYYVFNLASNWDAIWDAFTSADLAYVPPIIILMISTYASGAWSLMGATLVELSFTRTTEVMFGQSFLNRFTPANAGGMAMRVRYLQLNGVDAAVAAAAIGLTSVASGVAQGVLLVVFLIWGGSSDRFSDFTFPDIGTIVIIIAVIGLIVWFTLATTWGRTVIRPWIGGTMQKLRESFGPILSSPLHLTRLMGGATTAKLANIISFWLSVLAFDVDMSFPKAGALYMIANTIGSAVPTPGGVGGVEAALTAVLISFGVDNATAAAIVLLFRTLTFWLPTLPGYFFMRYCQRKGIV